MPLRRITRALAPVTAVLAVGLALVLLAPVQLGGRTGYVVTSGTSMEPSIHDGDLVLTRARQSYEVGDVVLYRSSALDRNVLHRIVARDGPRFVLEGDNNGYRDADRPASDRIVGEQWLRIPALGGWVAGLRRPAVTAALVALLAFSVLAAGRRRPRDRQRTGAVPSGRPAPSAVAPSVALGALAALGLFAALGALAWTRPAERDVTVAGAWAHAGAFSYTASVAPSAVYPTGRIATGDTVFTRLAKRLDVAFDYRFESRAAADVRGAVALGAVLSDGEGWSRRLTLAPAEPFAGTSARVAGTLDLRAVGTLVERMRRLTGSTATLFTVTVQPVVEVAGYAGPTVLDERYAPALRLALDASGLRPAPSSDGAASAFAVRRPGPAVVSAPAVLRLGPVAVDVARARLLGGLGVGVSLLVALVALAVALRTRPDAREAARRRFGARLVDADARVPESRWVTDVARPDELARIAEHYDRVVLRTTSDDADVYLVDDGVTVYRLVVRPDGAAVRSGVVVGGW